MGCTPSIQQSDQEITPQIEGRLEIDRVIALQTCLLNVTDERLPYFILQIEPLVDFTSQGESDQFVHALTVCARCRPLKIDLYPQLLKGLEKLISLKYVRSSLLKLLCATSNALDPTLCIPRVGLVYRCLAHGFISKDEVIDRIRYFYQEYRELIEYLSMLFCWFAPEIESTDPAFFQQLLEAYKEGQKKWNFSFALKQCFDHFDELRDNDWELFRDCRENIYPHDSIFSSIIRDDVNAVRVFRHHGMDDVNARFPDSIWAVSDFFSTKPTLIEAAAFCGSRNCFVYLLLNDADLVPTDSQRTTVMHAAIAGGCTQVVRLLDDMEEVNYSGCLHVAALFHQMDLFVWLHLQRGCDLRAVDPFFQTCLHSAAMVNNLEVLEYCLENGVNQNIGDSLNNSLPLHYAAAYGCFDFVFALLSKPDTMVCLTNHSKRTALHSACSSGFPDIVKLLLLQKPHLLSMRDDKQTSPAETAVLSGNDDIVKLLFNTKGCDRNEIKPGSLVFLFLIELFFMKLLFQVIIKLSRQSCHFQGFKSTLQTMMDVRLCT